ncbi:MAG TPA: hypothetical protein ENF18_02960 [candidate division WOR-3 bacterium]|uniref:Uncharacterized protein n=1 Tax=candidate division WOR-3 bacterium TaxID=2052148 RepID=A0A7C0VBZ0_UNCW3|nr:hypothetical protein [candidate division WOR-3 bacterium]
MILLYILSLTVPLNTFERESGVRLKGENLYLSGGFRGGYVVYRIKVPEGAVKFRMGLKMKNLSGSSLGIYLKNWGKMRSTNLPPRITKIDSSFFLWEATDMEEWYSSRPEYLYLKQGESFKFVKDGYIEVLFYAGGGIFKRGRFLIREINVDFSRIPDTLYKLIKSDTLLGIDGERIYAEAFFRYPSGRNDAQRRALALRGARIIGEKRIQDVFRKAGLPVPENFEVLSADYRDDGVIVKVSAFLTF